MNPKITLEKEKEKNRKKRKKERMKKSNGCTLTFYVDIFGDSF